MILGQGNAALETAQAATHRGPVVFTRSPVANAVQDRGRRAERSMDDLWPQLLSYYLLLQSSSEIANLYAVGTNVALLRSRDLEGITQKVTRSSEFSSVLREGVGVLLRVANFFETDLWMPIEKWWKHVRCNPDVAPRLNSDKLLLLLQSTYLPEGVPVFYPLLR